MCEKFSASCWNRLFELIKHKITLALASKFMNYVCQYKIAADWETCQLKQVFRVAFLHFSIYTIQLFHTASYSVGSCKAYHSVNCSQRNGHCWVNAECGAQWLAATPGD